MAPLTVPPGLCQMGFTVPIWKRYLPKEQTPSCDKTIIV
jgi:hypothetical protein